jgi:NAD(P)-dependent dehydrogenase (short-subunit alcohol dehydrogenase family)
MEIRNKVVALIGSTGILGSEYVKFLSSEGANVVIGDIDLHKCMLVASKMKELYNTNVLPLQIDLFEEESIRIFFQDIISHYGKLDVLINNAQVKPTGFYDSFEAYSKDTLMKVLEGNTVGMVISCQEACKIFLNQGYGNIINVASIYGLTGADQRLYDGVDNIYNPEERFSSPISYAVSKAGVVNMTRYLASYYREKGIRVNCLTPGGVFDNHDDNFNKNYSTRTLLGRMANKKEYNGAILFLASDASSYMTGANLIIDGGWTAF